MSLDSSSFSKKLWGTLLAICDFSTYSFSKKTEGDTVCDLGVWIVLHSAKNYWGHRLRFVILEFFQQNLMGTYPLHYIP